MTTSAPRETADKTKRFILDVRGAYLRRTDWSFANMEGAKLSGTDLTNANLRGVNLKDARLDGTILRGADLTGAKNVTVEQLRSAIIDETTKLPEGFDFEELRRTAPA